MPIYEYRCTACESCFEMKQSFDAEPVCSCPKCNSEARRQFRPAPIIFKGSGFYVTDYAQGSSATLSGKSEETKSEPVVSAAKEAKTETQATPDE
ncbi:MAG: FmdB family zinc ribbon protein [Dehalococcoidia bacterium]